MHFTDQWVMWNEANHVDVQQFSICFAICCCSDVTFVYLFLIVLGLMNDGKGWSLRQNRKVAPVAHSKASPSHSLQHSLLRALFYTNMLNQEGSVHFVFLHPLLLWITNYKMALISPANWDWITGLKVLRLTDVTVRSERHHRNKKASATSR